ncbi:MAG TPA: PKD domain-containing protein [Spirochaetota bacterium]|nr:PKD domain-containing protein [Spirochaetota bacterium]HPI90394.1 PKD domain-containing protein [Spirochaetota bacterium]HPR48523.1 PKD domain-containing protein [Spirochaetota bacterium]
MKKKKLFVPICVLITGAIIIQILQYTKENAEPVCSRKSSIKKEQSLKSIPRFFSSLFEHFHEPETVQIHKETYISNIVLEKETVCVDEEVEVYVEASNPGGLDSNLYYQIGVVSGNPAVVRFTEEGTQTFNVLVKDFTGTGIDSKEVSINVVSCEPKAFLAFKFMHSAENQEILDFEISDYDGLSEDCLYTWDFGDGTTFSTRKKFVSHDYRGRKYDRYVSSFVVSVTARDDGGNTAKTRQTVSIPNIHYISNQMGNPTIPVKYNRFPDIKGNSYDAEVTMYNIYDEDIQFTEAVMRFISCASNNDTVEENAGISNLLKTSNIPAGSFINDIISIDQSVFNDTICVVGIEFRGTLGNDRTVKANMYLDIPPSGRTVVASDKVVADESMIEKLNRAEAILGKGKPITPSDLNRLEREGKL